MYSHSSMVLQMYPPVKPLSSLANIANKAILEVVLDPPVGAETSLNLGNLSLMASSDALHRLAPTFLSKLVDTFQPDYIVGSVHHVHDVSIDSSTVYFQQAIEAAGGLDALYCDYFDLQYELITSFKPAVVGHMDLIRFLDDDYRQRMQNPDIWSRIERNLSVVKDLDLILDFNLKALAKGQAEPYIARPILTRAREMGIAVVPGDDVHRITDVDCFWDQGIQILGEVGLITDWRRPA